MSESTEIISLPREFQRFAEEEVRAGRYESVREVAQEAFLRLQQWDIVIDEEHVPELMAALEGARQDIRQGRYEEGSPKELMDDIREEVGL